MHVREWVCRVDGQRRQDGVDLGVEVLVQEGVLRIGQLLGAAQKDAVLLQDRGESR